MPPLFIEKYVFRPAQTDTRVVGGPLNHGFVSVGFTLSGTGEPVRNLQDNAAGDNPANVYAQPIMTSQNKLSLGSMSCLKFL